jgi:hypothetical protein
MEQEPLPSKSKEPEYPLHDCYYIRKQYHFLICAFPRNVRRILIDHIPTVDDFRRKAMHRSVGFSSRLPEKPSLDLFLDIFRQIYISYPQDKLQARNLYRQRTGLEPSDDLTLEEVLRLGLAEEPYNFLWKGYGYYSWKTPRSKTGRKAAGDSAVDGLMDDDD